MNPIYLGDWAEGGQKQMMESFQISASDLDGVEILLAHYSYEKYSGTAFVLFRRDGRLYEVNGSHRSCYGLEDQWRPEEVSMKALRHWLDNDYSFEGFREILEQRLKAIEAQGEVIEPFRPKDSRTLNNPLFGTF